MKSLVLQKHRTRGKNIKRNQRIKGKPQRHVTWYFGVQQVNNKEGREKERSNFVVVIN